MNHWQEFYGKVPLVLAGLGSTPRLYEGAWWMNHGGVVLRSETHAVGVGRVVLNDRMKAMNLRTVGSTTIAQLPNVPDTGGYTADQISAANSMNNALITHGYKESDMSVYRAFQTAMGLTADGYPGTTTMTWLKAVLTSQGVDVANVPVYPWSSSGGYDGVNAPLASDWGSTGTPAGPTSSSTTTNTTTNTTTTATSSQASMFGSTQTWLYGGAALLAAGIIYEAMKHKGGPMRRARRHAREVIHHMRRAGHTTTRAAREMARRVPTPF